MATIADEADRRQGWDIALVHERCPRRRHGATGPADDATVRGALIRATERQLAASADGDVSTRAVAEEAGVTHPALYRLFGDKRWLACQP